MRSFMYFSGYLFLEQLRHTICIKQHKFIADNIQIHIKIYIASCLTDTEVFKEHCVWFACDSLFRSRGSGVSEEWGWSPRCSSCTSSLVRLEQVLELSLPETAANDPCPGTNTEKKILLYHMEIDDDNLWKENVIMNQNRSIQRRGVCSLLLRSCWMLQIPECVRSQRGSECKTSPLFQWRNCKKYTETQNTVITERIQ